jgi:hypothetical protein
MSLRKYKGLLVLSALGLMVSCGTTTSSTASSITTTSSTVASSTTVTSSAEASSEADSSSSKGHGGKTSSSTETSSAEESSSAEDSSVASSTVEDSSVESSTVEDSSVTSSSEETSSSASSSVDTSDFTITTTDGTYTTTSTGYTISAYGTYTLEGTLEGMIYVDVAETTDGESEVVLELNGVTLTYGENSPIYVASADKVEISAQKGTTNTVTDTRTLKSEDVDGQGEGAIYAKADLTLKGKGTLSVTGSYNNGVHTTKDLNIKNLTLTSNAPNNSIKGNNSVDIKSGTVTAISTGGDGIKTEDSDVSSSGNQKGDVTIEGEATVNIYAACDGIDAAYNVNIQADDDALEPTVNIYTSNYSSYTGDVISSSETTMYLKTKTAYSSSYRYAVLFSDGTNTTWKDASYVTSQTSGGGRGGSSTYYYYSVDRPSSYTSFAVYRFTSSQTSNSTSTYNACSDYSSINTNYDTVTITLSGSTITTGSWSNYSTSSGSGWGPGGGGNMDDSGNTNKSEYSAKGIKADNIITIAGGTNYIKAYDDAVHANYGTTLDNGSTGVGNVVISGGTNTIYASDDGVHADNTLTVSGGTTTVTNAYEGLEGISLVVTGGTTTVTASDDGVNASASDISGVSSGITVTGGYLDVNVPTSGDVDGIDSNGFYKQSGGVVLAKGPNSTNMAAMDCDGTISVSGGSLIIFGMSATSITKGSGITATTNASKSTSSGSHTISFTGNTNTYTTKMSYTYTGFYAYSDAGTVTVS